MSTPFTYISKVISEWIGESYSVATLKRSLLFRRYLDSFPLSRDLRQARMASLLPSPKEDDIAAAVAVRYGGGVAPAFWADAAAIRSAKNGGCDHRQGR